MVEEKRLIGSELDKLNHLKKRENATNATL
jgi:hypothetical protein